MPPFPISSPFNRGQSQLLQHHTPFKYFPPPINNALQQNNGPQSIKQTRRTHYFCDTTRDNEWMVDELQNGKQHHWQPVTRYENWQKPQIKSRKDELSVWSHEGLLWRGLGIQLPQLRNVFSCPKVECYLDRVVYLIFTSDIPHSQDISHGNSILLYKPQ
jgi:hypothetical protein